MRDGLGDIAAILICVVLAGLVVFQLALVCGAPLGRFAWGGSHDVLPLALRIGSATSIVAYAVIAALVLTAAGLVDLIGDERAVTVGMWVLVGYFALGIVMNGISRSRPERLVMTPLVALLTILSVVVALDA